MSNLVTEPELLHIVEHVERVRRRLVLAGLLQAVAVALGGLLAFVVAYAWIDHRLHLGPPGRIVALILFGGGGLAGLYFLTRNLRQHVALAHAARYIESRSSYHQQLLTTIEYHANREHYPYSESLAQFMVRQVAQQSAEADWTSLVPRRRQWLAAGVILLGLIAVLWMSVTNGAYFARYLSRLTQPVSAIAPLPATTLLLETGDLAVAERTSFELAATIAGSVPDQGTLRLTKRSEEDDYRAYKQIGLRPMIDDATPPRLALLTQLPLGTYQYQFAAGDGETATHDLRVMALPEISSISAQVSPPEALDVAPYTEAIEGGTLHVVQGAEVTLTIAGTIPLAAATAQTDDHPAIPLALVDGQLQHTFVADAPRSIRWSITSRDGITNDEFPPLSITLSRDEPPTFEYKSPGSDYLATNVASIPLRMRIQDDFGLEEAALVVEVNEGPPERHAFAFEPGAREADFEHILELESLNLNVGDTLLVYGEARESASALKSARETVRSDVYFIEIRAYTQLLYQAKPSMGGSVNSPRGLPAGERLPTLLQALEYTRAIMKKTWSLQDGDPTDKEIQRKATSVADDAEFMADKLDKMTPRYARQTPNTGDDDLATVARALTEASPLIRQGNATEAVEPTKRAYRVMRALVDELEKAEPAPGGGSRRDFMEGIKLEEQVHATRFEDEQVQWALDRLSEKLEEIQQAQRELGRRYTRFLESQAKQEAHRQSLTDEQTTAQKDLNPTGGGTPPPSGGGGGDSGRLSRDGALLTAQTQGGQGKGGEASPEAMLEMLQAAQSSLERDTGRLEQELRGMSGSGGGPAGIESGAPASGEDGGADAREDARDRGAAREAAERLADARAAMKALQSTATGAYYQTASGSEARETAAASMDGIGRALTDASGLLEGIIDRDSRARVAAMMAARAEAAAEIARALDETTDPIEEKKLQSELLELIESGHTGGSSYVSHFRGAGAPPLYVALVDSIVPPADKSDMPAFIDAEPRRAARYLADTFWSLTINAEQQRGALRDRESADVTYRRPERSFYEQAARYEGVPLP